MRKLILIGLAATLVAVPTAAEVELHGFVEGAWGARTARSSAHEGEQDYTLQEVRAQVRLSAYGDLGEAFVRADFVNDGLEDPRTFLELREAYLRFTTAADRLDVKAGRQALTWGTGDLLFVNDLFPKDWESFFVGREAAYLKAPSDAARLSLYGLPAEIELVITPRFSPDLLPVPGGRFSMASPPGVEFPALEPANTLESAELAARIADTVGSIEAAAYLYRGFHKTPVGVQPDETMTLRPYHPELSVYGASLRGPGLGGLAWLEGGWYDSREDRDGTNPAIENSTLRYFGGYERQVATDFNATFQYYGEWLQHHDLAGPDADELYHLLTLRLEKLALYQTLRLSLFTFWSPTDEDAYLRPIVAYHLSDDVKVTLGGNVFFADEEDRGTFGRFDQDDNVYVRLRATF